MSLKYINLAKINKKDEFYTSLPDIEKELQHYREQFKDKIIYCNCDNPKHSNFFKYFYTNFRKLKLKKLIVSCHKKNRKGTFIEYDGTENSNVIKELQGNGDFRNLECIDFLKKADIVVTNPPFSLFREYFTQLMDYNKQFLVLGNHNAVAYVDVFNYFIENKISVGYNFGGNKYFYMPHYKHTNPKTYIKYIDNVKYTGVTGTIWFTTLNTIDKPKLNLTKKYSISEYPFYDDTNIINVNKTADIPYDYRGIMGVPITFINKYNPKQFKLLGISNQTKIGNVIKTKLFISGKEVYKRIFIQKIT